MDNILSPCLTVCVSFPFYRKQNLFPPPTPHPHFSQVMKYREHGRTQSCELTTRLSLLDD